MCVDQLDVFLQKGMVFVVTLNLEWKVYFKQTFNVDSCVYFFVSFVTWKYVIQFAQRNKRKKKHRFCVVYRVFLFVLFFKCVFFWSVFIPGRKLRMLRITAWIRSTESPYILKKSSSGWLIRRYQKYCDWMPKWNTVIIDMFLDLVKVLSKYEV